VAVPEDGQQLVLEVRDRFPDLLQHAILQGLGQHLHQLDQGINRGGRADCLRFEVGTERKDSMPIKGVRLD
jgi:hypothetical protein